MANRVNVNVTVRDLTRGQLSRLRHNFRSLGQDLDRAVGNRSRQNFARLGQSVNQARRDLTAMRGSIPDREFFRLDRAIRQAQRGMQRGFGRQTDASFARIAANLRQVDEGFRRLDESGQIRIRVDLSALRRADARLAAWQRQQMAAVRAGQNAILRADRRLMAGLNDRDRRVRVRVDPDVDGNRFTRILRRTLTSPFRTLGGLLGGTLSDGLGQGIIGGFKAAGPAMQAALAIAIAGVLSFLGAGIAAALVLAIGGAFTVLGGFLVFQAEDVKKKWTETLSDLKTKFQEAAEPMIPVVEHARKLLVKAADDFAPHFKQALAGAAPHVTEFMDQIDEGFRRLGEKAAGPLEDAFNTLLNALGPMLKDTLSGMGDSLAALARTVQDHSTEIAIAFNGIIGLITTLIDIINFLASTWVTMLHSAGAAVGHLIGMVAFLLEAVIIAFDGILAAAETAFSWVPGVGEKVRAARQAFGYLREEVVGDMERMSQKFTDMGKNLDRANRKRKLEVDITSLTSKLKQARADLQKTNDKKARAKVFANINDLKKKIAAARRELNSLNGKTAVTHVVTHYSRTGSGLSELAQAHGGVVGRSVGRAATGGIRSNMTLVGEHGPELVNLPPGSGVRSNPDTRRMMGQGGVGTPTLILQSSGRRVDDLLLEIFREAITQRGGDPVRVLTSRGR